MLQCGELPKWILDRSSCSGANPHCWLPYCTQPALFHSQKCCCIFLSCSPLELSHSSLGSVSANRWERVWGGRGCQGVPKDHLCGQGMHNPSQAHRNICLPPALHLLQRLRTIAVPAVPSIGLTQNTPGAACGDMFLLSLAILKTENSA